MATRFMTGSIPTTCSWSWLPNTIVHCSARCVGRRTEGRWENRRWDPQHSPIASQRSRTPFRRSLTTGSTRRTSATACSRPACTARDGRWRARCSMGASPMSAAMTSTSPHSTRSRAGFGFSRFHRWPCRSRLVASTKRSRVMWEAPQWTSTASRRQPRTIVHSAPVISGRRPSHGALTGNSAKPQTGFWRNPRSAFREGTHGSGELK